MKRRRWSLLATIAMVGGLISVAPQASAATTFEIQVGAFVSEVAESMRFFPREMEVNQGDTLHFTSESFHSATFMPAGVDPDQWIADNATEFDGPFTPTIADPDDGPKAAKFSFAAFLPSDFECGTPETPPCSVDGSEVVNSGLPLGGPFDFSATIDAPVGSSLNLFCVIHNSMRMTVNVVEGDVQSQEEIDAEKETIIASDAALAQKTDKRFLNKHTFTRKNGKRIWDAYPGVDRGQVSLFRMYPLKVNVRKGDKVKWHFEQLKHETHTVSMPRERARMEVGADFVPACDPDGDGGPGPDVPATPGDPPLGFSCPDGAQPELERNPKAWLERGDGKVNGYKDFESSGEIGLASPAPPAPPLSPYTLKFRQKSDPGEPFKYLCMIHPFMRGAVKVD